MFDHRVKLLKVLIICSSTSDLQSPMVAWFHLTVSFFSALNLFTFALVVFWNHSPWTMDHWEIQPKPLPSVQKTCSLHCFKWFKSHDFAADLKLLGTDVLVRPYRNAPVQRCNSGSSNYITFLWSICHHSPPKALIGYFGQNYVSNVAKMFSAALFIYDQRQMIASLT